MFDIFLTEESAEEPASEGRLHVEAVYGKIRIGEFHETFIASLFFWSRTQYEHHWRTALERIVGGATQSALIASYVEPPATLIGEEFLVWWPLYREREVVYVQNHLLFFGQLSNPFSAERYWESVGERQTVTAEGAQISEWITSVQSIRDYLARKLTGH
jgi:hypothetical protein